MMFKLYNSEQVCKIANRAMLLIRLRRLFLVCIYLHIRHDFSKIYNKKGFVGYYYLKTLKYKLHRIVHEFQDVLRYEEK